MNIFQKIRVLSAFSKAADNIQKENKQMETQGLKTGWKTTEFWMTVATNVVTIIGSLKGVISDDKAALIIAIANAVYGISRALTKSSSTAIPTTATTVTNIDNK